MNIGILGGSFDPPHFGHLLVARQTREIMGLDEIWLMPYFAHHWDSTVSRPFDRIAMTRLIEESGIKVSNEEVNQPVKSFTIDTIRRLKAKYAHQFSWIVGSDIVGEFNRWKDHEILAREVRLLVFPRNGHPIPAVLPEHFEMVNSPDLVTSNISSTIIRKRLLRGHSVVGLVPEPVLTYIHRHKLYDIH